MNIHDFDSKARELIQSDRPSPTEVDQMLSLRQATYRGFAELEAEKGILKPEMSIVSTHGQEGIRILIQRAIEEFMEAYTSDSREHRLEELIDTINYLWVLAILDPKAPRPYLSEAILDGFKSKFSPPLIPEFDMALIGAFTLSFNDLSEKLRNRAWMHNAQDVYFTGWDGVAYTLHQATSYCYSFFHDWSEFAWYYYAKDLVLQFRLQSRY